jgi:hypothetical protein
MAGIPYASGDTVVTMDFDLQHPLTRSLVLFESGSPGLESSMGGGERSHISFQADYVSSIQRNSGIDG